MRTGSLQWWRVLRVVDGETESVGELSEWSVRGEQRLRAAVYWVEVILLCWNCSGPLETLGIAAAAAVGGTLLDGSLACWH